ncbi:ubiquinol-cytochrome c reductase core subunit 10 qcr10 [Zygosaccharomyces mellis]|uniref:Ubiquinol-cytochrome c reductase core subunit 10 qcr10 n=1 Tax=Zygosaccharomyces mellis TaxID=42258 RepID=A0A4C2E869_9SACH|nr:ubiquinol-cytochrome c reductase core subunit 10 qcr10 [Zygosaccharomyces mellis]
MVSYVSRLAGKTAPHFGRITPYNLLTYAPNLLIWGGSWWAGLFVITDAWPKFQETFYQKIPFFGGHWIKEIPPEDRMN